MDLNVIDIDKVLEWYKLLLWYPEKETGTSIFYRCPFHHEKTPSFSIKKSNGFYKCFWCWKSWNIITLINEKFPDKKEELFQFLGLKLWFRNNYNINYKKIIIQNLPNLIENRLSKEWIQYLKSRGLTKKMIKEYNFFQFSQAFNKIIDNFRKKNLDTSKQDNKTNINKILENLRKKLEKYMQYYEWYLILPISYKSLTENSYYFIWRLIEDNPRKPRYKNEKMNKNKKTFYIWSFADKDITLIEGGIDWCIYNYWTWNSVNLMLGANKFDFQNKIVRFLTDNDQAGWEFTYLTDLDNLLENNNVYYNIYWITFKEIFEYILIKYIPDKYNKEIKLEKIYDLIETSYYNSVLNLKDINDIYLFIIKLLFVIEETIWKNKIDLNKLTFDFVQSINISNISESFVDSISKDIKKIINFLVPNIESNTYLILLAYYYFLKQKINRIDWIEFKFLIEKVRENSNKIKTQNIDFILERLKEVVLIKRNPYFVISLLTYYFDLKTTIYILNLLLFKNLENLNKQFEKWLISNFFKEFKIEQNQEYILFLFKTLNILSEETYNKLTKEVIKEQKRRNNSEDVINLDNIYKANYYYNPLYSLPALLFIFRNEKSFIYDEIVQIIDDEIYLDIINLIDLLNNKKIDLKRFNDMKKIDLLIKILKQFQEFYWKNLTEIIIQQSKNTNLIFLVDSFLSFLDNEYNKKILEKTYLDNLLTIRKKEQLENENIKEEVIEIYNFFQPDNNITENMDSETILNRIKTRKNDLQRTNESIDKYIKYNRIIFNIFDSLRRFLNKKKNG